MNKVLIAALVTVFPLGAQGAERKLSAPATSGGKRADVPGDDWKPKDPVKWRRFRELARTAKRGDLKGAKRLLDRGVDVNGRDAGDDFVPIERPLTLAAAKGHERMVALLLSAGADPNWCCCSCTTALHVAILTKRVSIVRRILDAGGDPRIPYYEGEMSTLELAKTTGVPEIVKMVEERLPPR